MTALPSPMPGDDDRLLRTLVVDDEPPARAHLKALLALRDDVTVVGECGDGRSAVERITSDPPDLVLLDIQMPELDGLGVLQAVGAARMPAVVFVTAYDQYALAAFDVHAFDYLLKPVNRERFTRALDRVVTLVRTANRPRATPARAPDSSGSAMTPQQAPLERLIAQLDADRAERSLLGDRIAVRVEGRVLFVRTADVDWIEAADDHVRLHVGKTTYLHRDTLARLEQRLPPSRFLRIHRSTVVNVERIRELQPWFQGDWVAVLADGTRLQSGRSYRARVREFLDRAT